MIHPLLRLLATEPHLLSDHVEAYAGLVGDEVTKVSTGWAMRLGLYVVALFMLGVGLVLVGVSLLLWAALPTASYTAPWAMFVVPIVPLAVAGVCILVARAKPIEQAFATLRKQFNADMAMLRDVSAAP